MLNRMAMQKLRSTLLIGRRTSENAASAALRFVSALRPDDHLLVLLSGGGSALLALPAGELSLEDKRDALTKVARGGANVDVAALPSGGGASFFSGG